MEGDDANPAKENFSDSDGSSIAKPGQEDVITTGIEKLNITDHQEERKGNYVAEQPIQEEGYDGDEDDDDDVDGLLKAIEDLNITQQQQEMATPPSSSSSSSSFPSPQATSVYERKRKSVAEQPIQEEDSDREMTDDLDLELPFLSSNKRNCRRQLLFQEDDHSIGVEPKIETTKRIQLSISSHCALGDAPASVATDPADDQDSDNQVEEDQDQESPRNTGVPLNQLLTKIALKKLD